ncbi:MAG: hypothetical protein BAA02_05465 [Paenibacillaceae bacterium ZCTH02-B3]|nr:MAG: hypothetical protein BAA02_05465 [Paenibacillaceae bacterium ZCTH02-B3]
MKKRNWFAMLSFILVFSLLLSACGGGGQSSSGTSPDSGSQSPSTGGGSNQPPQKTADPIVLKMGGIQAVDDLSTQAMYKMSEIVAERTGGAIKIEVYPASQLGDAVSQMEGVQLGTIDAFVDAGSWVSRLVQDKNVESLFFIFEDEEHYRNFLTSDLNIAMEQEFADKQGIVILANNWLRAPRVMVSSKKPILTVEDMKGLKMRVPDIRTYLESVQALGAKPTQVAWGEVYLALRQGVVEAAEGPLDAVYTMKFYEPAPYITLTNHIRDNMVVMMNRNKLESLSQEHQDILFAAAREAGDWYTQEVKNNLDGIVEEMKKSGAQIYETDVAPFVEFMVETAKKLEEEGLWRKGLFEEVQALK